MRGRLLASTALAAAGFIGSAEQLHAQTAFQGPGSPAATTQNLPPAPSPAAASVAQGPRFVIRIYGFFTHYVGGVWQDDRGATTTNAQSTATTGAPSTSPFNNARPVHVDQISESRIRFQPDISLDNGFRAGGLLEFNTAGGSFTARRTFAYLAADRFGEIRLGNQNLALYDMLYREPSLARGYTDPITDNAVIEGLRLDPTGSGFGATSPGGGTMYDGPDDGLAGQPRSDAIGYFTPRVEGLQLGVTFSPEHSQNRAGASAIPLQSGSQATYRNAWSVAANFNRTFESGVVVRLSGGYSRATAPDQGGQGSSLGGPGGVGLAAGTGTPDPYWWYVGGYVGYRGLSVGGSYGRSAFRNFGTGSNSGTSTFLNTVVSDGYAWTVGATYNYGPYGVGVAYMDGRNSDCSTTAQTLGACGSRDRNTIVVLMGSYQLGPGVFWEAGYFHAKSTGNEWNNGTFVGTTPVAGGAITPTATGAAQNGLQSNRADGVWSGLAIVF
jgi:predicted porin